MIPLRHPHSLQNRSSLRDTMIRKIFPKPTKEKDGILPYKDDECPMICFVKDREGKIEKPCPFLSSVGLLNNKHYFCDVPDC